MATPVQRWTSLVGALLDTATPPANVQTAVADACCLAQGRSPAEVAVMSNTDKARLALKDVTEFLRSRRRAALAPVRRDALETQLTVDTTAELPEVP